VVDAAELRESPSRGRPEIEIPVPKHQTARRPAAGSAAIVHLRADGLGAASGRLEGATGGRGCLSIDLRELRERMISSRVAGAPPEGDVYRDEPWGHNPMGRRSLDRSHGMASFRNQSRVSGCPDEGAGRDQRKASGCLSQRHSKGRGRSLPSLRVDYRPAVAVQSLGEAATRLGMSRPEFGGHDRAGTIPAPPTGYTPMIPTRQLVQQSIG